MRVDDFERLARAIVAAREAKRWNQADLVRESGLGRNTVHRLESGTGSVTPSRATTTAIDRALDWAPGSTRDVLDGGEPRPLVDADFGFTRERVSDTVELVSNVIRRVFVAVVPGTPISEVLEAEKLAVELFRAEGLLPPASTTAPDVSPRIE